MGVEVAYESHAITEDNEHGIATGWLPGHLSRRGREAAAELGIRHRDLPPAVVLTSDLAHAVATARIAFGGSGIPIHQDRRLREYDYGRPNGGPVEEVAAVRADHVERPFPGGQSY